MLIAHWASQPAAVSADVLRFASLQIALTVREVVGAVNWVPLIYYSCSTQDASIAKVQLWSLATESCIIILFTALESDELVIDKLT